MNERHKKHKNVIPSAVTRIRTWVIAATTQCTNHYTITAMEKQRFQSDPILTSSFIWLLLPSKFKLSSSTSHSEYQVFQQFIELTNRSVIFRLLTFSSFSLDPSPAISCLWLLVIFSRIKWTAVSELIFQGIFLKVFECYHSGLQKRITHKFAK